jgi:hypothetical protein
VETWPGHLTELAEAASGAGVANAGFPLWKVCIILALLMLAAETLLLTGGLRAKTAATH